ncbi:protein kinase [Kineothrix sp. MSJ-39]|uniref:protein kinase domain-containing protein n=1 Tax=Kineothrix sp. MSJ-39 TaxID=2841533 RepID=UPI001C0FF5C4|nr:protein kinase [Kineothrix sp. MSJ-39]MBU5430263.1 protein kinase [Kineothrix sp. MSJ-39]
MAEKERNTGERQIQNSQIADEFLQNYTEQAAQKLPVFLQDGYSVLSCYYAQEEKSCYLLQKKETQEKYIVKCRKEREDRDSLQKEYEELGRLAERYPNLYQRATLHKADGYVYLLRAYMEGKNLEEYVAEDPYLKPERQLEILEEICQAVARLHAMDPVILHRDMKPQNLILDAGGHVHLIDFETAREYDGTKKKDTVFFGTEGSAAPEQYGYAQTDVRTDVFGIGKIAEYLYEEYQVGYDPLTEKRLQRIIKKATAFDPADRYQNVQALLLAFRSARRQTERGENKWLKAALAIESIVLLLVLAGALFFRTGFQKTENTKAEDYVTALAEGQAVQQDETAEDPSAQADPDEIVTLEGDPLLLQAIRETAGSDEVTKGMLSDITRIAVIGDQIYTEETPVEDLENLVYQDGFNDRMVNGGITDLSVLTNLPNLKEVFLCNQKITDISPLQELSIEGLYVCGNQIEDFSPVEKMQELTTLYLVDNPVRKVPQLSGCTKLTRLALCGNNYETLDFLEDSSICNLYAMGIYVEDESFGVLSTMQSLTELYTGAEQKNFYEEIPNLTELRMLSLWGGYFGTDLQIVSGLENLQNLFVNEGRVNSLAGIEHLQRLEVLCMDGTNATDISPLAKLPRLQVVRLQGVPIEEFTPLFSCQSLQEVGADSSQKEKIEQLGDPTFVISVE